MHGVLNVFIREFKSYFYSPIAYVFIILYLVLTNFLFFQGFFVNNQASMVSYFGILPWVFLFFIPAVTMRAWAEEKKLKTLELLLTWPINDTQVVFGKFLSCLAFLGFTLLCSITVPITVAYLGEPDGGQIFSSYVAAFLLGGAYISIGLWISSLTEDQIVAFLIGMAVIFVFMFIGNPYVIEFIPTSLVPIFSYISLSNHFESMGRGVLDSRDVLYYLSVMGLFLFLNIRSLESRKWE